MHNTLVASLLASVFAGRSSSNFDMTSVEPLGRYAGP